MLALSGLLAALVLALPGLARADTFAGGDLIVSASDGSHDVRWLRADGSLVQTLDPGLQGLGGAAFDPANRLYVTGWLDNKVVRFDTDGTFLGSFIDPFHPTPDDLRGQPAEIAFDPGGNAFVGDAGSLGRVRKFDASGALIAQLAGGESDRLGLGSDGCTVSYGGNDLMVVNRMDVCSGGPVSFSPDSENVGQPRGIAILADGSALVAWEGFIRRYASDWTTLATYDLTACTTWLGLEVGPDGTTFWSSCRIVDGSGTASFVPHEIDLATGSVVRTLAGGGVVMAVLPADDAAAAESCVYDPAAKSVTASITPGGSATLDVVGGAIRFGAVPTPCGGATTTNTDSISIAGSAGTTERLTFDQRTGLFGPGATPEFNIPEIEIATTLGDATDTMIFFLTEGNDVVAAGQNGLSMNSDGDLDITVSPGAFRLEYYALGGNDIVNARGSGGAGLHFLGPVVIEGGDGDDTLRGSSEPDEIFGGNGNDRLEGDASADLIEGGPGNDNISAGDGPDTVTGGPGSDTFSMSDGNDTVFAADGEADGNINGGAGIDTVYYDGGLDPNPVAVENRFPTTPPPPPPPPPGACTYDAPSRTVTAQILAEGTATLRLSGDQVWFGGTPAACGAATRLNTDKIDVLGPTGSTETLTIDQSSGAFAPGVEVESGTSEIELSVRLGDAADRIVVIGTAGDDMIAVGQNGVALNTDGDVDVTFLPLPARVEVRGLGGNDTLGRGANGAGASFGGVLALLGGDGDDSLLGALGADSLDGGPGADLLEGRDAADVLLGGDGDDTLAGGDGNDELTGGAGADSFAGSAGDDVLFAADGTADTQLSGGQGVDTAYYDAAHDPFPLAVENRIPQ